MIQAFKRWKLELCCILGGMLLCAAVELSALAGNTVNMYLPRNPHGEGSAVYELLVGGLSEESLPLEIELGERQYSKDEAEKVFETMDEVLLPVMLNENSSLDSVRSDLNLVTSLPGLGVRLRWSSEYPDIVDSFGTVTNEVIREQGQAVVLRLEMSDGTYSKERSYDIHVLPPELTEEELAVKGLRKMISNADTASLTEKGVMLPAEYDGKKLYYRDAEETNGSLLLVLGFVLAGLCYAKDISDKKAAAKLRERQLLLDYSEVVSKLLVFFGAGLTVSSSWERMVRDYERDMEQRTGYSRYAYEEMCVTYYQVKSGTAEGRAYAEFGKRCGLQPYRKLAGLLEQSRKNGMKNLKNLLQLEMSDAFEQRKNTARRLGEEASTKLLVPLMVTLGIVMIMIVMPAFLSFY